MTTLSPTRPSPTAPRSPLVSRSMAVLRMHLADKMTLLVMPTATLAAVFAVSVIIWQFVPPDGRNSGGMVSTYCFLMAVAVLAVARALPFAMGMGASRRAFFVGTVSTGLVLSFGYAALLFVLQLIERASGGWWSGGTFFWLLWFRGSPHPTWFLFLFTTLAASFMLGALLSSCWARWNRLAMLVGVPSIVLVGGGLIIFLVEQHKMQGVIDRLYAQTMLEWTGWFALAAAVFAALFHVVLRRVRG